MNPCGPAFIPEQIRIDPALVFVINPDRLRPGSGGIGRVNNEMPAVAHIGRDDPEAVAVEAQRGRIDPAVCDRNIREGQLRRALQGTADKSPIHQVAGMMDRQTGK